MTVPVRALRARAGHDTTAGFDGCFRALNPVVRAYLSRLVPPADIEDVTQLVFVDAWRSWQRYDPARSLRAWVLAIARRRAVDHLRARRLPTVPLSAVADPVGDDGRCTASRAALADEVRSAIAGLSTNQRRVLTLCYFYGLPQSQVAAITGLPLGTVKTSAARGLARLGRALARG